MSALQICDANIQNTLPIFSDVEPSPDEILERVASIRASWSEKERLRRRELGDIRRNLLAARIGLIQSEACA